jgi:hypothetical protein
MSLVIKLLSAGVPVAAGLGFHFFRPVTGFTIGTAGQLDFGISVPDAVHVPSGSIM